MLESCAANFCGELPTVSCRLSFDVRGQVARDARVLRETLRYPRHDHFRELRERDLFSSERMEVRHGQKPRSTADLGGSRETGNTDRCGINEKEPHGCGAVRRSERR